MECWRKVPRCQDDSTGSSLRVLLYQGCSANRLDFRFIFCQLYLLMLLFSNKSAIFFEFAVNLFLSLSECNWAKMLNTIKILFRLLSQFQIRRDCFEDMGCQSRRFCNINSNRDWGTRYLVLYILNVLLLLIYLLVILLVFHYHIVVSLHN